MSDTEPDYLKFFGEIKFAEEKSLSASDFESSLTRHLKKGEKIPRGRYKFAELNNKLFDDFTESFKNYFEE